MLTLVKPARILVTLALLSACNGGKFSGGSSKKGSPPGPVPVVTPTSPPTATPTIGPSPTTSPGPIPSPTPSPIQPCSVDVPKGAHVMLIIDNSTSTADTDCPGRKSSGGRFTCDATNREAAGLAIFDRLSKIREAHESDPESLSTVAIANFTPERVGDTRFNLTLEPHEVASAERGKVIEALAFTRRPYGDTPYRNAVTAAKELLDQIDAQYGQDGKKRIVLLVTDGEPTDSDPAAVKALADQLKARAEWITVMLTSGQSRQARLDAHRKIMTNYEQNYNNGAGWRASHYATFDAYMIDVFALPGQIASRLVEVAAADQLKTVITDEIIKKVIECKK